MTNTGAIRTRIRPYKKRMKNLIFILFFIYKPVNLLRKRYFYHSRARHFSIYKTGNLHILKLTFIYILEVEYDYYRFESIQVC